MREVARRERHLVGSVGAADTHEQVVLRGHVVGDVALALGPVLTADDHVDARRVGAVQQAELSGHADEHVVLAVAVGINHDVSERGEVVDRALGWVLDHGGVVGGFLELLGRLPPRVALRAGLTGRCHVDIAHRSAKRSPQPPDLPGDAGRVDDDELLPRSRARQMSRPSRSATHVPPVSASHSAPMRCSVSRMADWFGASRLIRTPRVERRSPSNRRSRPRASALLPPATGPDTTTTMRWRVAIAPR